MMKAATTTKSGSKKRFTQKELDAAEFGKEVSISDPLTEMPKTKSERNLILVNSFRIYANTFDNKKDQPFIKRWLKDQKYFDAPKQLISGIRWNVFSSTIYGLMRLETRGWILSESEIKQIEEYLWTVSSATLEDTSSTKSTSKKKISVFDRMKFKIDNLVLNQFEGVLDQWVKTPTASFLDDLDIENTLRENEIPLKGAGYNLITAWIQDKIREYEEAKTHSAESYFPNSTSSDARLKAFNDVIKNLKNLENTTNAARDKLLAFREKRNNNKGAKKNTSSSLGAFQEEQDQKKNGTQTIKTIKTTTAAPQKQVENLKYLKHTDDFGGLSSIPNPEKIVGKSVLFLFNVKYRKLTCLFSKEGFTVTGTTVKGFDKEESFSQTLRKPEESLKIIKTKTKAQIKKYLKDELTTKQDFQYVSGRCQDDTTILLRVL